MKNYTKYAFLTLLVATSGLSAQPRSMRDRWNDWKFANSRVGRFLGLNTAVVTPTNEAVQVIDSDSRQLVPAGKTDLADSVVKEISSVPVELAPAVPTTWKDSLTGWFNTKLNSGKQWCTATGNRVAQSKPALWLSDKYNATKNAVTNSFKTDAGYGKRVVQAVKDHPYVAAATAGVVSYPVVKCLAKKFWNAKPNHKFGVCFVTAASIGLAAHAGIQMPQVDPRLAAAVAGGCAATGLLDGIINCLKAPRTVVSSSGVTPMDTTE